MRSIVSFIRHSLSVKLSLCFLLLAVPIFLLSLGILFQQSRSRIKQEAMERAISVLNTTAQRVNCYLNTVETATNVNEWFAVEHLQPDSLLTLTHRIVLLNSNVNGCSVTTEPYLFPEYGRYFSAYSVRQGDSVVTVREGEYEYFEKVWYKTPRQENAPCWVDPFDDYNEGTLSASEMIASYCKPLLLPDGQFIGVISTDLSLRQLSEAIQTEHPYPHSYFIMLGKDGHYFVHPDTTRLFRHTIFSDVDASQHSDVVALGHEMIAGKKGAMGVTLNGQSCLVCYQPLAGTPWSVALICPDSDILKNYHVLTNIILALIIIGLLLILLFGRVLITHALRPLNRLVDQIQLISSGHYEQQIVRTDRMDVIGRLNNSFAAMLESLDSHVKHIQQVNEETAKHNEELADVRMLAEEASRQKQTFIQNMTHQIRTPLNIIIGFAQVLRDSVQGMSTEEVKSITDVMNHNSMGLSRMVLMLYDSSDNGLEEELNSHRHELVSCNEVAREAIDHTYLHFPNLSIIFETELTDDYCIYTNRLYLMRSLREILYNSAKYSDGEHILLHLSETENTVIFTFQDTGAGMADGYHEQLFQPFTKVDDLSEGLGLGLPLTKRHITNLGGTITLDTSYHGGCRVIIEIPKQ